MITFEELEKIAARHAMSVKDIPKAEWIAFANAIHECVVQNEKRPCFIRNRPGYTFLRWVVETSPPCGEYPYGYKGEFAKRTYGLVIDKDGNIIMVRPEKIRFTSESLI